MSNDLLHGLTALHQSPARARRQLDGIAMRYGGVDFAGKRVLDIGGGIGAISVYAASRGASEVVCLDPGDDGALLDHADAQERFRQAVPTERVTFVAERLQDYQPPADPFDVVILNHAINHLDEAACERLPDDPAAVATYVGLFTDIAALTAPGGLFLAADVSPHNLFTRLGRRNPFTPSIEWHKHQTPETWISLLHQAGFGQFRVRWVPLPRFGTVGRVVLANPVGGYLTSAHFIVDAVRVSHSSPH